VRRVSSLGIAKVIGSVISVVAELISGGVRGSKSISGSHVGEFAWVSWLNELVHGIWAVQHLERILITSLSGLSAEFGARLSN